MSASVVLRRRLGNQLRELRSSVGIPQEDLAERIDVSRWTIMRTEAGENLIRAGDLTKWLDACGADPETRERLTELGKQARKRGGWWSAYRDLLPGPYVQLEAEAAKVRSYEPLMVPGLLQTEDYIRAGFELLPGASQEYTDRHIEVRTRRQQRVASGDLAIHTVVDEAVLQRLVGNRDIMKAQLQHLVESIEQPNVTVRIIPFGAGMYRSMGLPFVILSFREPSDPDIVMAETLAGEKQFEEAEEIAMFNAVYDELDALTLGDEGSARRIKALMAQ